MPSIRFTLVTGLALLATACGSTAEPSDVTYGAQSAGRAHKAVCADPGPGEARCHAHVVLDASGQPAAATTPSGYGPSDIQSAYNLPSATAGIGQVVAIVDAYDYPNAEADLAVYRSQFGLPPCTTANGCFRKVDQNGGTQLPRADSGWSQEEALDLDMVSAVCPNCKIILVEAKSAQMADLGAAVDTAVRLGANVVSNSYGGGETTTTPTDDAHFNHPGVAITVSSGDNGYGVQFPASSQYVTAVGGTSLKRVSGGRGWAETAWSGAGSGCSKYIAKPSWQKDSGCSNRMVADVSAVADPSTGVGIYWTNHSRGGWMVFGGTSVAAPLVGAVYALAANESTTNAGASLYSHTSSLFDVTSGSNGSCGGTYECTSVTGYDGPTGLGTPNGVGAF